jgi:phage gp16-like protein
MTAEGMRRGDLARIHLAKKDLGLDDDAYRDVLKSVTGKTSAAELSSAERFQVILAMGKLGAKVTSTPFPGRPVRPQADKAGLIRKIEAQLAEAKRPWSYAHAMAVRMFKVDQVQWCDADQLRRLVAALAYDAKRHGGK